MSPAGLFCRLANRFAHLHALPAAADPLIAGHPVAYSPASGLLPLSQNAAKGSGRLDTCAPFGIV